MHANHYVFCNGFVMNYLVVNSRAAFGVCHCGPGHLLLPFVLPPRACEADPSLVTVSARSGNMPNVPPGVPMQYFVGQTGMPTFYPGVQQIYGYEEMQALQQRLPHLVRDARRGWKRGSGG